MTPCTDYFDVLDSESRPVLTERDILRNLQAIVADADTIPVHEVCSFTPYSLYMALVTFEALSYTYT